MEINRKQENKITPHNRRNHLGHLERRNVGDTYNKTVGISVVDVLIPVIKPRCTYFNAIMQYLNDIVKRTKPKCTNTNIKIRESGRIISMMKSRISTTETVRKLRYLTQLCFYVCS